MSGQIILFGATGTVGRAVAAELVAAGWSVSAPLRRPAEVPGVKTIVVDLGDTAALSSALAPLRPDAVISCMASRDGRPADSWAVDRDATIRSFEAAQAAGARRAILVSAICVQKPKLDFQFAKLEAEAWLANSGMAWSVVRPTALFKSLSGQIHRVRSGKPFLVFGSGELTSCTPISDRDLGRYVVDVLEDEAQVGKILPIGGPGPALTPLAIAAELFHQTKLRRRVKHVPLGAMDLVIGGLSLAGRLSPAMADKAAFARIGRYYATESMLVWDDAQGVYDRALTPSYGSDTLQDHFRRVLAGEIEVDLGEHAVF